MAEFLSIRINPVDFNRRLRIDRQNVDKLGRETYDRTITELLRILQNNTPHRTGKLARSWRVNSKRTMTGGISFAASAYIESKVPYAQFVERGAKPSKGRFVPKGKRGEGFRIKTGIHPGQEGQGFVTRSIKEIESKYLGYASESIGRFERRFVRRLHGKFK